MKWSICLLGLVISPVMSFAALKDTAPQSRAEYCRNAQEPGYFRNLAYNFENHMAFDNFAGGFMNGGVCWWHALYHRASLYLSVYRPELPKPTAHEAQILIDRIADGREVVEIPGYHNLAEFSADWEQPIKDKLVQWQAVDGILRFVWIQDLLGKNKADPAEVLANTEKIEASLATEDIQWVMWKLSGVESHGVLYIDMNARGANENFSYLDSNFMGSIQQIEYVKGSTSVPTRYYGNTVPEIGRMRDLMRFRKAAQQYCSGKSNTGRTESQLGLNNDLD